MNPDFGTKHLTGLAWLLSLVVFTLILLLTIRKKKGYGEKFDRAVIRYTCYFMWAWEIIKTVRMINYTDYGPVGYYPLWMAPFHICSMGLYAYLIVGSKNPGKLEEWVRPFSYAAMMIVTSIILIIPGSASLLGNTPDWSFCFDNILPYQTWLYHGSLLFVSLYMAFSGFIRPKWSDLYKSATVFCVVAAGAQALNYILEGSGADFMTLRYGNGNPFAYLLYGDTPAMYYVVVSAIALGSSSLVLVITKLIRDAVDKKNVAKLAEENK
jgi:hypothetical protein